MTSILTITAPVFILMGIGFFAVRFGLVERGHLRGLGAFVLNFALPALIFHALAGRELKQIIRWDYVAAYGGGSLLSLCIGYWVTRKVRQEKPMTAALNGMGVSLSNTGFIGFPIILSTLGPPGAVFFALNVFVENVLILPLFLTLIELAANANQSIFRTLRSTIVALSKNPMIIALVCGLAFSLSGWQVPVILDKVTNLFAQSASAVALFVIGGNLFGIKLKGRARGILEMSLGKLVLHPLLVLGIFLCLPGEHALPVLAAVLLAAAPMGSIFSLLGQRYGEHERTAAVLMGVTLLSFISLNVVLWAWKTWFPELLPN